MQYAVRRRKGFRHICPCGFHGYAPIRGFVVFTPYASWQGIGFMAYALLSLVPWITEDHGSV